MLKLNSSKKELQSLAIRHKCASVKHFSNEQKQLIIEAYLKDKVPLKQLCKEFNVSRISIWRWISNFANEDLSTEEAISPKEVILNSNPMPGKKENVFETPEQELARLREENKKLQEALKMAEWSNHAKDVMIDLAEQTFNIPIRKKSGAKQ